MKNSSDNVIPFKSKKQIESETRADELIDSWREADKPFIVYVKRTREQEQEPQPKPESTRKGWLLAFIIAILTLGMF